METHFFFPPCCLSPPVYTSFTNLLTVTILQPLDKWEICLHNRYPAYIAWDEFVANQAQLRANSLKYREEQPGVARKGQALSSRDRALWAMRSLVSPALFGQAGRMARVSV